MAYHRNLSDSKSPQVFRTLFSSLDDLNSVLVWMVSTIAESSSLCTNHMVTVPRAPVSCSRVFSIP